MAQTHRCRYVLYKEPGSIQPPWPGVEYDDKLAPADIQRTRPSAYMNLVLLLTEPYSFHWATTSQLVPLNFAHNANVMAGNDDLRRAYERAAFMADAGVGCEYWQGEVNEQLGNETLPEPAETEEIWEDDSQVDEEVRHALDISLKEHREIASCSLLTPSLSPPKRPRRRSSTTTLEDDNDATVCVLPRAPTESLSFPKRKRPSRFLEGGQASSPIWLDSKQHVQKRRDISSSFSERRDKNLVKQVKLARNQRISGRPLDNLHNFGQNGAAPTSDVVEGELSESLIFAQVFVGPQRELFTVELKVLETRPYFRDPRTGTNYLVFNDAKAWELRHPELATMDPVDFQLVAEWLTDKDFGVRIPESIEQNKLAIAQCVAAWETAEKLGAFDMLEFIAQKVNTFEWDNADVLTFAIMLYRSSGPVLHAHEEMRDWVAGFLAHHFWTYVKDETMQNIFRKRIRMLPELERDIFIKRAENLKTGAEMDEDQESDEDMGDDDL